MSKNDFNSQLGDNIQPVSAVTGKLRFRITKRSVEKLQDSFTRPLATALLVGTTAYFVTACNSTEGASDAESPISAMGGASGTAIATANTTTPSGGTGGTSKMSGVSGSSATTAVTAPLTAGTSGDHKPTGGAGKGGKAGGNGMAGARAGAGGAHADAGDGGDAATEKCDKIPPSSKDCAAPLAPGDDRKCSLSVGLNQRDYYLYAGKTYNPCKPVALIIDCHGAMETAEVQAGIETMHYADSAKTLDYPGVGSGWRLEADTAGGGFIVATPQGLSVPGVGPIWSTTNNDPEFFMAIVEQTKKIANIAVDEVYMTGISNGSIISYQTACPNTNVFSGIAAHSAGSNCTSIGKPIPVISFDAEPDFAYATTQAASDTMVSLNKCTGAVNNNWLTIDSTTTDTVCRNDPFDQKPKLVPCNTITKTSITASGIEPTVCKRWDNCEGGVAVVFCDVAPSTKHGAENASVDAHILYGNATSLNTPSLAWRFFKSFWKK
jgi:poly(3-hydroxybutyrate) depolymerase